MVIAHSFWTQHYLTIDRTFTLDNYRTALTEPIYRDLLLRSLYVSLVVSFATVVLAYPVAYFISFHGGSRKSLWLFLITIPFWTSYLIRVMSWKVILGYNGVLNSALMGLGITQHPRCVPLQHQCGHHHADPCLGGLRHPADLRLAGKDRPHAARGRHDLGDGPLRSFLRITLPLSMPGVIAALLIVMIPTVGDYVTPKLVGGADGVMIANAIQTQFGRASNWPLGAALSVTTMVFVTAMAGLMVLALRGLVRLLNERSADVAGAPAAGLCGRLLCFLYLPILLLPLFSFNNSATPKLPLAGFTSDGTDSWPATAPDARGLEQPRRRRFGGDLPTVLGICAARAITRYRFRGQKAMSGLIMAPLVLPEIIVAVSLLLVLLAAGLDLSLVTIVLGHVLICVPYSITVLMSGFEGFDRSLEEASTDLGESAWGTFRRVTLPMVTPAIMSSLLVAFTISLDEFIVAFFLSGTETTLPIYIWGQLRFPAKLPGVLALGTILLAASFVLLTAAEIVRRRAAARARTDGGYLG